MCIIEFGAETLCFVGVGAETLCFVGVGAETLCFIGFRVETLCPIGFRDFGHCRSFFLMHLHLSVVMVETWESKKTLGKSRKYPPKINNLPEVF